MGSDAGIVAGPDIEGLDGTIVDLFAEAESLYKSGQDMLVRKLGGRWVGEDYATVRARVLHVARALVDSGIKSGDRVAIMSGNRPEWALADMGGLHAAAVTVPIYDTLTPEKVAYILNDSASKVIFVEDREILDKVLQVRDEVPGLERIVVYGPVDDLPEGVTTFADFEFEGAEATEKAAREVDRRMGKVKPEDLATIVYTSGTTGEPKGVMLTHDNLYSNVAASRSIVPIEAGWIALSFLPLSHVFERMAGYYLMIASGCTIAYAESVAQVPANMGEVRPHIMASVPRLYEKMYAKVRANVESSSWLKRRIFQWAIAVGEESLQYTFENKPVPPKLAKKLARADKLVFSKIKERVGGRLVFFVSGGAALSPTVEKFFNAMGVTILPGYGLTETSPVVSVNTPDNRRLGSVGKIVPGVQVKLGADDEILVRGKCVMQGYWNKEKDTKESFTKDGWLKTGDVGRVDADGFLFITDRKKELFVLSNGKNVAPQPIENDVKTFPHIAQCVLIGDGRNYCTALIAPDFEAVQTWAKANGVRATDPAELVQDAKVQDLLRSEVEAANKRLARYEQIKKFRLLPRELTQEAGELTPTMKVKRRIIDTEYADLIEEMYKDQDNKEA
ncbi:MAG: long-chain fatty acid--CoA ligase [Euryarchaeota archaeon]|nr:long-chain fatty acid--CoA ligase [Euryarchaeota archaeon]